MVADKGLCLCLLLTNPKWRRKTCVAGGTPPCDTISIPILVSGFGDCYIATPHAVLHPYHQMLSQVWWFVVSGFNEYETFIRYSLGLNLCMRVERGTTFLNHDTWREKKLSKSMVQVVITAFDIPWFQIFFF